MRLWTKIVAKFGHYYRWYYRYELDKVLSNEERKDALLSQTAIQKSVQVEIDLLTYFPKPIAPNLKQLLELLISDHRNIYHYVYETFQGSHKFRVRMKNSEEKEKYLRGQGGSGVKNTSWVHMKELKISEQTLFTDWKNIDASLSYASSKFGNFTKIWKLVIRISL